IKCSWQIVPCKHIGAVYYQLGDRFSEDPFVLFQLRGRTKEQIISDLRQLRSSKNVEIIQETAEIKPEVSQNQYPVKLADFWQYAEPLASSLVVISPAVSETILDTLGTIPFTKDEENTTNSPAGDLVMKYLQTIYKDVSQKAFLAAMNVGG
ncbi:hypothetical protein MEN24_19500, partial [Dolichospermum sp. ST_sed10]|nr:hypothetical protein [Dolichospermum sp. ST_sed10]